MNLEIDESRFTRKIGKYQVGTSLGLKDFSLQAKAQDYKRKLSALLYPVSGDQITEKVPNSNGLLASRKIDGEFNLLFYDGQRALTINPGGTVRVGLPCLFEAEKILARSGIRSAILAVELNFVRKDGTRSRVHDVIRVARNPENEEDLSRLCLTVFDVVEIDGKPESEGRPVLVLLDQIFGGNDTVNPVKWRECSGNNEIKALYHQWVLTDGAEGIVIRSDRDGWYKVKPEHTIDVAVVGFSEGSNERRGLLHDLLAATVRADGTFHTMCKIGGGFTEEQRRGLFLDLQEMIVPSDYTEVNSDHVAYELIRPSIVVEMKCLDIISEKSRGGEINRMVLSWTNDRWNAIRRMPFVSIISPRFVRLRDDKEAVAGDVSINQISNLVDVPKVNVRVEDLNVPQSEVIRRDVYTKEQAGKKMLRKLLLWKTNKESTGEYPEYIVYLTDFSSVRKSPLDHDIKPAKTIEQAEEIYRKLAEKNFLKGWQKV